MYHKCTALLLAFGVSAFSVGLADARVGVLAVENNCNALRVVAFNRCTKDGVIPKGTTQISLRASFKKDDRCSYQAWDDRNILAFSVIYSYNYTYFRTVCTPSGGGCTCNPAWGPP